jgi:phospholipid/cholesterol/gamma-HCH transport system permease protein
VIERVIDDAVLDRAGGGCLVLDLADVGRLDTVGAILLQRLRKSAIEAGETVEFQNGRPEHRDMIAALEKAPEFEEEPEETAPVKVLRWVDSFGGGIVQIGRDIRYWVAYLGAIVAGIGRLATRPSTFRATSFAHHLENVALRAAPIIALISFLVGAIVAQQSIFQLRSFGATIFVVDLIGILTLRELGVLLTSIMIAGRSGSAFTAELGSMKMREEIDALRVMGLDPIEVLVLPRLLALVLGVTLLAFLANLASLGGGAFVAYVYGGISFEIFVSRLRETLTFSSFVVGMIKAPFMGLIIAMIATIEGMAVSGSAESLGKHTTSSVVKAIFMVILLDGMFAMLFAAIGM